MKYKIPVYIQTTISKHIGVIECNSLAEFEEKANKLWESQGYEAPSNYACNDYDMGEWDLEIPDASEMKYFEEQPNDW